MNPTYHDWFVRWVEWRYDRSLSDYPEVSETECDGVKDFLVFLEDQGLEIKEKK